MADVSVGVRGKRKRGRPRKDSNLCREGSLQSPDMKSHQGAELLYPKKCEDADKNWKDCSDEGMVGSMVYGVVEGSFDAGYLISVRIGNNLAPFRGVVFQPRKVVAVTAANDVAPQAKMYQRREVQVPGGGFNPQRPPISFMAPAADPMLRTGSSSNNKVQFPYATGNLRMVEEDEVMQAFEVSTSSGGGTNGKESITQESHGKGVAGEIIDELQEMKSEGRPQPQPPPNLYYNENLFSAQSQASSREAESLCKTPSLKLDLAFTAGHRDKEEAIYTVPNNIGYHQALVAGNPLLLPPDLIGEPLELMMEKPKTPTNCNASLLGNINGERIGGDHDAITNAAAQPYNLQLATPHSPLNTRIADMDFLLTNANQ